MTTMIKPGILVALSTSVNGGVQYARRDIDSDGAKYRKWETEKFVEDPEENARATKARSTARAEVARVCFQTAFGLLCPEDREKYLDDAIENGRRICDDFNSTAKYGRVAMYVLKGRIAASDAEAARAIGNEVASLLREMERSIDKLDPKAIRAAAAAARQMAAMIDPKQERVVRDAIEAARKAASTILRRVEKEGATAAEVLAELDRSAIAKARFAFIDASEVAADASDAPALPAVEVRRFADLDEEAAPEAPPAAPAPAPPRATIDLDDVPPPAVRPAANVSGIMARLAGVAEEG
jgi:hypothetical protein